MAKSFIDLLKPKTPSLEPMHFKICKHFYICKSYKARKKCVSEFPNFAYI